MLRPRLDNGVMYFGSKSRQKVGDFRVLYKVVYPTRVSLIAKQSGTGLINYVAQAGGTINMLSVGDVPAEAMFQSAMTGNTIMTWGLRFAGLMLMFIGLKLILRVLSVLADVVPLFGNIIGAGTSLIAFLTALVLSLITIAIAWLYYRPLIGGILLAAAIGIANFTQMRVKKALVGVPGVLEAEASHERGQAVVTVDPKQAVSLEALVAAVQAAGYEAEAAIE